jgi:acyl dehydratase
MLHELGHGRRDWEDVEAGQPLPERVIGPHSIVTLTTEYRAQIQNTWGAMRRRTDLDIEALGYTKEMAGKEMDGEWEKVNPEQTDGAYIGPSRGHLSNRWARFIGMPRAYAYGISMGAWMIDYFAGWAGEWGFVVHANSTYRSPALIGDITITTGQVLDKTIDAQGRGIVQVECRMTNQLGAVIGTSTAEVELPRRG